MAKTEEELLKMSFMQLRNHCKSLDIDVKLGGTKGSMIKMILAKDPPKVQPKKDKVSKEDQLKQTLTDTSIYNNDDEKKSDAKSSINIISYNDDGYKDNKISLDEARKIVKRYCPRRGQMGMTVYPGFLSVFRAPEFKKLSISEFMNALITGNESILGLENMKSLHTMLDYWDAPSNNNGWNLCIQHLDGFHPTNKCSKEESLMFSIFIIPDIIPKLRLMMKICDERAEALDLLYFMDTFNSAMKEIENNDIYSKIFLSSILLSKFRNEDIKLNAKTRYKNVIDFLQKVAIQPSAKEMFQSKRWNTLKKKGKLIEEINKPQMVLSDADFNKIRAKAIEFGSAVQPQMPRVLRSEIDKKAQQEKVKKEIGSIDTKALQSKLQNALKHKLGGSVSTANESKDNDDNDYNEDQEEKDDEKNTDNDNNNEYDMDLTKYHKMLSMGVPLDAVVHKMTQSGVSKTIIEQFVAELSNSKSNGDSSYHKPAAPRPRMPNALLADIGNAGNAPAPIPNANGGPPPAPAPLPNMHTITPAPIPMGIVAAAPPPALVNGHGVRNGMVASSIMPKGHNNKGLNWQHVKNRYKATMDRIQRMRVLIHALDSQLYQQQNPDDNKDNDDNNDNVDDEKYDQNKEFHDSSFKYYMAQINRIESGMKSWIDKNNENEEIFKRLEVSYHSKFRPMIFKELTSSRYNALKEAANAYDDVEMIVSDDVIGVIWMFVKPFDELVELKFAVDCINEFFNKDKKKIEVKKLPIQSHRGYEPFYLL